MSLLGGGLARVLGAAFGGIFLPATLHRRSAAVYDDGGSVVAGATFTDAACRAQIETATYAMRGQDGFVDGDMRIMVLTTSVAVEPGTDDEITVNDPRYPGVRWQIANVGRDPAGAYWDMRGRRA